MHAHGVQNFATMTNESMSMIDQRRYNVREFFGRLVQRYNIKNAEGAFLKWKQACQAEKKKNVNTDIIKQFHREVKHMKKNDKELELEIARVEK